MTPLGYHNYTKASIIFTQQATSSTHYLGESSARHGPVPDSPKSKISLTKNQNSIALARLYVSLNQTSYLMKRMKPVA
jgi:hypothetical protein